MLALATYAFGILEGETSRGVLCLNEVGFGDVEGLAGVAQLGRQDPTRR